MTKQDKIKQVKRLHIEIEPSNPRGGKESKEQEKEKKDTPVPTVRSLTKIPSYSTTTQMWKIKSRQTFV